MQNKESNNDIIQELAAINKSLISGKPAKIHNFIELSLRKIDLCNQLSEAIDDSFPIKRLLNMEIMRTEAAIKNPNFVLQRPFLTAVVVPGKTNAQRYADVMAAEKKEVSDANKLLGGMVFLTRDNYQDRVAGRLPQPENREGFFSQIVNIAGEYLAGMNRAVRNHDFLRFPGAEAASISDNTSPAIIRGPTEEFPPQNLSVPQYNVSLATNVSLVQNLVKAGQMIREYALDHTGPEATPKQLKKLKSEVQKLFRCEESIYAGLEEHRDKSGELYAHYQALASSLDDVRLALDVPANSKLTANFVERVVGVIKNARNSFEHPEIHANPDLLGSVNLVKDNFQALEMPTSVGQIHTQNTPRITAKTR